MVGSTGFDPHIPCGCAVVVVHVSWVRTGSLITYEVRNSDNEYLEQRTAFLGPHKIAWTMVNHRRRPKRVILLRR